jgi:hypothetical protein
LRRSIIVDEVRESLRALATETASKLDVLGLNGNTLGMNSTKVGVLEEGDQVSLDGLLKSTDGRRLETKIGLEVLGDLTNQPLEGKLANQKLGGLLVATNLTKSDGTRLIPMRLLDTTSRGGRLASNLMGELLARSLSSSGLASGLFSASHCY